MRQSNPVFLGKEHLTDEGRTLKHEGFIKVRGNVNVNKTADEPIEILALDLETDAETGELKLLGFFTKDNGYAYYESNFVNVLYSWVKYAENKSASLAYWNRLDPFVLFKILLEQTDPDTHQESLGRFGKVSAEWDNKKGEWAVSPVVSIKLNDVEFGICQVIRSSVQFYFYKESYEKPRKVWAYDIAQLFESGLAQESYRLPWYSKFDESAHIVDWDRYMVDIAYQNLVLKSNEYDARACMELAYIVQDDFKNAFGAYPRTLISTGSLARSATVATLMHDFQDDALMDELKSIGIAHQYDEWAENHGKELVKDLMCVFTEAYSGGYIEALEYGYCLSGWHADIASAYPGVIVDLLDLRDSIVLKGAGVPPIVDDGYIFIRGDVDVPAGCDYNPITIKSPIAKDTNIRATGKYRASYTHEERAFMESLGTTFDNEEWFYIKTNRQLSALAKVCRKFVDLRKKLISEGNSSQYMAKIAANSLYGILYEAVDTYEETLIEREIMLDSHYDDATRNALAPYRKKLNLTGLAELKEYPKIRAMWGGGNLDVYDVVDELETKGVFIDKMHPSDIVQLIDTLYRQKIKRTNKTTVKEKKIVRAGYRSGEFWNPLYATIITSRVRIQLAKAGMEIKKRGGKPIILMTDSITWQGDKDMLPAEMVRDVKTLGFFETPTEIFDIVCLGTGRYGYRTAKGKYVAKKRGMNAVDIMDPDGVPLGELDWQTALDVMRYNNTTEIEIMIRTLISVGMVYHSAGKYTVQDLGRIIEKPMKVNALVGRNKRQVPLYTADELSAGLCGTEPYHFTGQMLGSPDIIDTTFPELRAELMGMTYMTRKEKKKHKNKNASKRYYKKNRGAIKKNYRQTYGKLIEQGYTSKEASRMANWSQARLESEGIRV